MSFLAGWRLALRLAWRDIVTYKGRSALAGLLIFLPMLILGAALAGSATLSRSPQDIKATQWAHRAATITFASDKALKPDGSESKTPAKPLPGGPAPSGPMDSPSFERFQAFAGKRTAMTAKWYQNTVKLPDGPQSAVYVQATGDAEILKDIYMLRSGRVPTKDDEVLVTNHGLSSDLPDHGTITITTQDGAKVNRTIVGTASTFESGSLIGISPLPTLSPATFHVATLDNTDWHAYGANAMTWRQATDGVSDLASNGSTTAVGTMIVIALIALLAGPAFAASATRSRRSLGLLAANGARPSLLRRVVLAQALLLGAASALVGLTLGAALGAFAARNAYRVHPELLAGPVEVPVKLLIGGFCVALISACVAALAPALAAGRTNLLQALRGQVSARKVRVGMPLLGAALVAAGVGCLWYAAWIVNHQRGDGVAPIMVGIPLFFAGAVMVVPGCLALAGRSAKHLPVSMRIAVRDVSRQRTRATASVGAVLATATALVGMSIFMKSYDAHLSRTYSFEAPLNSALIGTSPGDKALDAATSRTVLDSTLSKLTAAVPGSTSAVLGAQGEAVNANGEPMTSGRTYVFFGANACTKDALRATLRNPDAYSYDEPFSRVIVMSAADIDSTMDLTSEQTATLKDGGVLVLTASVGSHKKNGATETTNSPVSPALISNGMLTVTAAHWEAKPGSVTPSAPPVGDVWSGMKNLTCTNTALPARTAPASATNHLPGALPGAVVMLDTTARQHHWPTVASAGLITKAGGLSAKDERTLKAIADMHNADSTNQGYVSVWVERGYSSPIAPIMLMLTAFAALLMLVSAVIATLLSEAEAKAEAATLAAVGASAGMRRRIAAGHAWAICFLGSLIGLALGFAPGAVLAVANTTSDMGRTRHPYEPLVLIPWVPLLTILVAVPVVAALIVALFTRRTPTVTRREV